MFTRGSFTSLLLLFVLLMVSFAQLSFHVRKDLGLEGAGLDLANLASAPLLLMLGVLQ